MASFCNTCQKNGVNTRVEWRENPQYPGKNKPFDIDKGEWHKCPYYKFVAKQELAEVSRHIDDEIKSKPVSNIATSIENLSDQINKMETNLLTELKIELAKQGKALNDILDIIAKQSFELASKKVKQDDN